MTVQADQVLDGQRRIDRDALTELARQRAKLGARWLARVVQPSGAFPYTYDPRNDSYDFGRYNEVRHAGTTYALFQAAECFDDSGISAAAEGAARFIVHSSVSVPTGGAVYLHKGRAKLGGQALALIALLERRRVTGNFDDDGLLDALAAFLQRMEIRDRPGRYFQSYEASSQQFLVTPDSDYYPGEALLALTRLAVQFPDSPYLAAAQRAATFLLHVRDGDIVAAGRIPREDHWLAIALGELYRLDPNPDYVTVANLQAESMIANQHRADDSEPWQIGGARRSTTINYTSTATKAEALLAVCGLAAYRHDDADFSRYSEAALRTVQFLMRVQYTADNTSEFLAPERVIGAWAQDAGNPRIRLDFVQHNISALIGAWQLFATQPDTDELSTQPVLSITIRNVRQFQGPNVWSSLSVTVATVDLGALERSTAKQFDEIRRSIEKALQRSSNHEETPNRPLPDAGVAQTFGDIALRLQQQTEVDVDFTGASPTDEPGVYQIAVQHRAPEVAAWAVRLTASWLNRVLQGRDIDADEFDRTIAPAAASSRLDVSTKSIVDAAQRRSIPIQRVLPRPSLIEFGTGAFRRRILTMTSSKTSSIGAKIAGDKNLTNHILREAGLPVPRGFPVRTVEEALDAANQIGYPVVLKPLRGNHAIGVFVDLDNEDQVRNHFPLAQAESRSKTILVERFIAGDDFRILVIGGQYVACYQRQPAAVVGDGVHTIQQLIDVANADPRRGIRLEQPLSPIKADIRTLELLEQQGESLDSVPAVGSRIALKPTGHIGGGGTPIDRTDDVHPDNQAIACMAAQIVGLDIAGIDLITPDIAQSMWTTGGAINEVNSGPGFESHLYPGEGEPRDIGKFVIDMMYPPGTPVRVPVVAVAGSPESAGVCRRIARLVSASGRSAGLAAGEELRIAGVAMPGRDSRNPAGPRVLLNNPNVEIAVVEVDAESIIEDGLGFDPCDVAIVLSLSGLVTPYGQPMEGVLLRSLDATGTAILNGADPAVRTLAAEERVPAIFVGLEETSPALGELIDAGHRALVRRTTATGEWLALVSTAGTDDLLNLTETQIGTTPGAASKSPMALQAVVAAALSLNVPVDVIRHTLRASDSAASEH